MAVTGPGGRGVLGEAGTGTWLGIPEVKLGTGVVPCGGDRKGGGAEGRPPRLSFALLGARGRKITEVVPDRCPCKPGVKGLAERLNMLGTEVRGSTAREERSGAGHRGWRRAGWEQSRLWRKRFVAEVETAGPAVERGHWTFLGQLLGDGGCALALLFKSWAPRPEASHSSCPPSPRSSAVP